MSPRWAPLEDRLFSRVDKSGECWLWTGAKNNHGYGSIFANGKQSLVHRVSYEMAKGPIPAGMVIDHTCHEPACLKPDHLRAATQKQNMENRAGAPSQSTTGIRGVTWNKATRTWRARVHHYGVSYHVGLFETLAEAEAAAIAKRNELYTCNTVDRSAA